MFWNVVCSISRQRLIGELYSLHQNRFEFYPDPRNFLILRRESMAYAFRNILSRFVLVLGVLALLTTIVWAQAGTGELTGLVADPSGAVVPNAQVTLTNSATGDKRTTVTTAAGVYRFSALPIVGTYTLEVAKKGFKAVKVANLVMSVGTTVTQDVKLELGTGSEQVTVEAGAEVVQTSESSLSQLVDRRIWQQMPLQVRNQNSFIELVAGAVPQDGTNSNRGAEVNGTRSGAGSYLVDGTDNNEQGQAGRGQISFYDKGGAATSISPDAIQEYRVITNSNSAVPRFCAEWRVRNLGGNGPQWRLRPSRRHSLPGRAPALEYNWSDLQQIAFEPSPAVSTGYVWLHQHCEWRLDGWPDISGAG